MNGRDKLIELIEQAEGLKNNDFPSVEEIADHLLANGVIVPPCKVGDTVYYIVFDKVYKGKCHAITQHENRLQIHLYDYDFDNASIKSENVFLTKEEAEEKLKEHEKL